MAKINLHRNIVTFFETNERRKIYLHTIFVVYIFLTLLAMIGDLIVNNLADAKIEALFTLLGFSTFVYYLKSDEVKVGIVLLTLQAMALIYALMISNHFNVPYFHIILPLAFFLLYAPKTAFALTFVHSTAVILLYLWGARHFTDSFVLNDPVIWVPIVIASLYIVAFGPIYYLATEAPYRKLEESLAEKEVLLNEVHHRVKNNLNLISSILGLQILRSRHSETVTTLKQNRARIDAIAGLHEMLCFERNVTKIDMQSYLTRIADSLLQLDTQPRKVHIDAHTTLPFEIALKLGMIVNEFLSNSLKHNPQDPFYKSRTIELVLKREENETVLRYQEPDHWQKRTQQGDGIGLKIVNVLCNEIKATMTHSHTNGTSIYLLRIPDVM